MRHELLDKDEAANRETPQTGMRVSTRESKQHRRLVVLPIVLSCAIVFLAREPILDGIGNFLIVQDTLQPADLIHVIAGADYRTDHAIRLYQQGYGRQIFFTGGWCNTHQGYHGEMGRARALEQGMPSEAIAADDTTVTSTYSEAVRLKEFIAQSPVPIHSVIIVSDPFHMRRARWTFRYVLGDAVTVQMAPVPFDLTPYQRRWWTDKTSQQYVKDEYLKMAYYYLRYQLGGGPLQQWLVSLDRD